MIVRPAWFDEREPSVLQRLAMLPLDLAAQLYGAGASLHRAAYRRGVCKASVLPCRVIAVGNLAVGGSGKTPLAAWLAAGLKARGHRVVLASRGYGRRGGAAVEVVSDGRFVRSTTERAGDEPMLLAAHAPGVPVLVGRDRAVVGRRAVSAFDAQVLVLDDGFHHHRLARDVDLLAVDGGPGFGNHKVLPRGPLREPLSALRLADGVAVVDGPLPVADEAILSALAPTARRFAARRAPRSLSGLEGGAARPLDLAGARVGLLCGIARPASFRRTVEALGAEVVAERSFPDHHRYRERDLSGLAAAAPRWLTTEKDAVKILPRWAEGVALDVLRIALEVAEPEALLGWVENRLRARAGGRPTRVPAPGA